MGACIDPFGAPEFLVDDIAFRQMIGTEQMRVGYYTCEEDERILRVKLVFPVARLLAAQHDTRLFLAEKIRRQLVS